MVPRSLYGRLALSLFVLLAVFALGMVAATHVASVRYQQEATQQLNRDLAQHIVSERLLIQGGRVDQAAWEEVFHMLMVINPSIELYLVAGDGKVLAYSAPPGTIKRTRVDLAPIRTFLSNPAYGLVLGDDPRDAAGRKIFSAAPILSGKGLQGYLYIILASSASTTTTKGLATSYVLRASAWTIALAAAAAFIAGLAVLFGLTRRLRRLSAEVHRFKRPDRIALGASAAAEGDEIAELAQRFHEMATRIDMQMQAMAHKDDMRREQVAAVSHDLRTSLTCLHGYLETLQGKSAQLSAEARQDFLDRAVKHSWRLARLVTEFFELARLDYRDARPTREWFSMHELAQDVVQKFQPRAAAQGMRLRTQAGPDTHGVQADIGMIERVLSNLIDNAIKFTPAGGEVVLRVAVIRGHIEVSVIDTGPGMDAAAVRQLAEPGVSRAPTPASGDSSGLGLAIVRRILSLHGSKLHASSVVGQGCVFGFSLPLAVTAAAPELVMET